MARGRASGVRGAAAAAVLAGWSVLAACGGAGRSGEAAESTATEATPEPEKRCCCERYDDDGKVVGASFAEATNCKNSGGTCGGDPAVCESE